MVLQIKILEISCLISKYMYKYDLITILGPTASGKTSLSIELAKQINGEIVSADSMQIYKEMDIGTAKIKESEKEGIEHFLFDILLPLKKRHNNTLSHYLYNSTLYYI